MSGHSPVAGIAAGLLARGARIRLLVSDVDGCWTDGRIWLDADGRESVAFHAQDGFGVKRLHAAGVEVALISGRINPAVAARAKRLGLTEVHLGVADKTACLAEVQQRLGVDRNATAALGDDLPDLALFQGAALSWAPANAVSEIRDAADLTTLARGGHGAVREVCDWLLTALRPVSQ